MSENCLSFIVCYHLACILIMINPALFLQLREKRLEQEKELLIKQKDWFESQLKEKSEAYFTLKKEHVRNGYPNHNSVNHIMIQTTS